MTDSQFTGLSRPDRNDLRAFVRTVRDGRTATFDNNRIGEVNERRYDADSSTIIVRETYDAALELVVQMAAEPTSSADSPATLSDVSDEAAALSNTLVSALNDAFGTDIPSSAVTYNETIGAFVVRMHIPSRELI